MITTGSNDEQCLDAMEEHLEKPGQRAHYLSGNDEDQDEYGLDMDYDEELEQAIQAAESQAESQAHGASKRSEPAVGHSVMAASLSMDIEDLPPILDIVPQYLSPFAEFRRKGFLSVSDLVGTVWCEVQYDYRLRTLPYLPASQRPDTIRSIAGKEIVVDKGKVEDKEKILRRGNLIHKRLEREIHPVKIRVTPTTREDVWGLRFLNMLSALEALITIGKCRELPVVGFINGIMIMGIIDEIVRKPIKSNLKETEAPEKRTSLRQTNLNSFLAPSAPQSQPLERNQIRTHRLYVSDSKTRANGSLPRESDTLAGRLQVMMYKELLDSILLPSGTHALVSRSGHMDTTSGSSNDSTDQSDKSLTGTNKLPSALPTLNPFSFASVFAHLSLDSSAEFSEDFIAQSRPIIDGNDLRHGAKEAKCLDDLVGVWNRYVELLGLGTPTFTLGANGRHSSSLLSTRTKEKQMASDYEMVDNNAGRTEDELALVYRRAGAAKRHRTGTDLDQSSRRKGKSRGRRKEDNPRQIPEIETVDLPADSVIDVQEEMGRGHDPLLQKAMEESLKSCSDQPDPEVSFVSSRDEAAPLAQTPALLSPVSEGGTDYWNAKTRSQSEEREEEELAWAVEMSLGGMEDGLGDGDKGEGISLRGSQKVTDHEESIQLKETQADEKIDQSPPAVSRKYGKSSGSIIGKHHFTHDPKLLAEHLDSVLAFWMGKREPKGVDPEEAGRCAWCEFENDCEWRTKKANEAWEAMEARRRNRTE